jgi:hypothetical protein
MSLPLEVVLHTQGSGEHPNCTEHAAERFDGSGVGVEHRPDIEQGEIVLRGVSARCVGGGASFRPSF